MKPSLGKHGTSISSSAADERVRDVRVTSDTLAVDLMDGRTISVPLVWFPRLCAGTAAQRKRWEIVGAGFGIRWPALDEDVSTAGLLRGHIPQIRPIAPTVPSRKKRRA